MDISVYPFAFCFAMTKTTPEARPTRILSKLGNDHCDSYNISPMNDTGILFNDPTRLNVVGVVEDKNHRTEKEIPKETKPESAATIKKAGFVRSGCCGSVVNSPCITMTANINGLQYEYTKIVVEMQHEYCTI